MRNLNQNGEEFDLIAESGSNDFDNSSTTTIRQVIIVAFLAPLRICADLICTSEINFVEWKGGRGVLTRFNC